MRRPLDMAEALGSWLSEHGCDAQATPVPDDLESRLPLTIISSLGGQRTWPVLDRHRLQVDTYGETMADALDEALNVYATLDEIQMTGPIIGGVQAYKFEAGGLPAESDDPNHPDVPVASFLAQVSCRAVES